MKLYRATPDQLANLRYVKGYCEDAFYKLGYINDSSVSAFYLNDDFDFDTNPLYKKPDGKFFYKDPWDAVSCSSSMHGGYNLVRVLEFDFPDEIIDESIRGFALYNGRSIPEAKIPYEILEIEEVIDTPLTPELESQLRKTKLEILKESLKLYSLIKDWPNSFNNNEYVTKVKEILNNPENCNKLHELNIDALIRIIKCKYITGRMFSISRQHRHDGYDISEEGGKKLISDSNGILTQDNYKEWQENREKILELKEYRYSLNDVDWKFALKKLI